MAQRAEIIERVPRALQPVRAATASRLAPAPSAASQSNRPERTATHMAADWRPATYAS